MRRLLAIVTVAAGLGLAAAPARAQAPIIFYFGATASDTAVGLVPGATSTMPIRLSNPTFGSYGDSAVSARLVVHFDPAKIAVLGATPSPTGGFTTIDSTNIGIGTAMVAASGSVRGSDAEAFRLLVQLLPGATEGAYLWLETDSVQVHNGFAPPYGFHWIASRARFGTACHASYLWGDVDGNNQVNSRDALITLSAAVGLPVSGFDLGQGDVDGDGLTNSRDALMMLSFSIGLSTGPLSRVGVAVVDACPGLTAPGETVVFSRDLGAGTGGIFRLDSLSTTPVQLTSVLGDQWPRLNATGTAIAFQCPDTMPQVCRMDADGANRRLLTSAGAPPNEFPDWSPDGTKIVYLNGAPGVNTDIFTMDSSGANQFPAYGSGMFAASVAWSRNGTFFALSNPSGYGIYVTQQGVPYSTPLDANFGSIQYAPPIRWSPDGTLIATVNVNGSGILTLPATGGTSAPASALKGIMAFDWGPQGIIFALPDHRGVRSLWMLQGGFGGPLVRLTDPGAGHGDDQPSFRRNP